MKSDFSQFFLLAGPGQFNQLPAIVGSGSVLTYAQLCHKTSMLGIGLRRLGIDAGHKVAILSPTSADVLAILFALIKIKAIAVLASSQWPAEYIARRLESVDSRWVVCTGPLADQLVYHSHIKPILLENILSDTNDDSDVDLARDDDADIDIDRPATIVFSPGSTGEPKGVLHSLGNHLYSAAGSNENVPISPGDSWLLSLPIHHVSGLQVLFRAFLGGGSVTVPKPEASIEESILIPGVSHVSLVYTQLSRLLKNPAAVERMRNLKAILVGGSAIPDQIMERSYQLDLPVYKSYGSTEMASQITTTGKGDRLERLLSSGRLLKHRSLSIAGDGEILVRGETLFQGYLHGNRLDKARDRNGWFHTGDIGLLDDAGYLTVLGRKDNMFISGGENIHPEEIEQALLNTKNVENAVVVPVEDEKFGMRPAAFIKSELPTFPDEIYLRKILKESLPKFKIPDYFFPWPQGMGEIGFKVDRKALQALARTLVRV
jgi:O-succinylbenzoic acid--CoA ligase